MVCDVYGATVSDVAPVTTGSGDSGLVEDSEDWHLGYIQLSRNIDGRVSSHVDIEAIHT